MKHLDAVYIVDMERQKVKDHILTSLSTYPVLTKSMLSVNTLSLTARELGGALEELIESGEVLLGAKPNRLRSTTFYYLAKEAEHLERFTNPNKRAKK